MALLEHFLLLYNVRRSELVSIESFGHDVERATDAYAALEREYRDKADHEDFEIVLVGADSLDTVHMTHSRYFEIDPTRVPFLV
jgi:hypothetical protein